jgi:hypothetical protein
MPNTRVPQTITEFNVYVNNALDYLNYGDPQKNSERLTITEGEVTLLTGIVDRWKPLYVLYSDKEKTRTPLVVAQLQDLMTEFNDLNQSKHLLNRIAASANVTVEDLKTFNIKNGSAKRSVAVQPIQETINVSIQLLGGGSATFKCRAEGSSHASIIDMADCIQYTYLVGTTPPASADDAGLFRDISTKATFTLALGSGSSTKYLYIYFRWYNTKHPELAGPWTRLVSTLIV